MLGPPTDIRPYTSTIASQQVVSYSILIDMHAEVGYCRVTCVVSTSTVNLRYNELGGNEVHAITKNSLWTSAK